MDGISVVMCTYNGERYVEVQLASILAQTRAPVEIIVSDDGSTDATLDIVRAVAGRSPIPVRVHRNESNLGFADNFLGAAALATGSHIAFSDQDDRWGPDKLRAQHNALLAYGAALCVHPVHLIDSDGVRIDEARSQGDRTRVVSPLQSDPWGNFYGFTMLFERALLDHIPAGERGLDPHARDAPLSHDRWIYFLAATFGRTVVLGDRLAEYRQHASQMYGGEQGRSLRERIATKLADGQSQTRYLASVAGHRAAMLESGAPARTGDWAAGARRWRTIEAHLVGRERLYEDMSARRRAGVLAGRVRDGTYRGFRHGGLGPRRLAEDVTVTVLRSSPGLRRKPLGKGPE